jgi:hypothetical protein
MNHHIKITLPCISLRHITRNFVTSKFMHFFCLLGIYLSFSLHSSLQTIVLNYKVLKLNIHSFSRFIASFTISMPPFIYFNSIQIFPKKNSISKSPLKKTLYLNLCLSQNGCINIISPQNIVKLNLVSITINNIVYQ